MKICRWCNVPFPQTADVIVIADLSSKNVCHACSCVQGPIVYLNANGLSIELYFNPDLSLYLEFVGHGKSSRYILSPEHFRNIGALIDFDHAPKGIRNSPEETP